MQSEKRKVRRGLLLALLALLAAAPTVAGAQQARADSIFTACLAADTATRWREVAAAWSARRGQPVSDPALRERLLALEKRDQEPRLVPGFADSARSPSFGARLAAIDSANAAELREIVARHGWPTASQVGIDGAEAAFLIAQHGPSIRPEALRLMLALPPGEVSPSNLATLHDRVLTSEGKPQRYGSQMQTGADGVLRFPPIEEPAGLDERRAAVGQMPFSAYLCVMRGIYGPDIPDPR